MANKVEERVLLTEPEQETESASQQGQSGLDKGHVGNSLDDNRKLETLSEKLERFAEDAEESRDTESINYKPPTEDPYRRAVKYMEMHNVMQIFQHLTSEIVYHRPTDPLTYMLEEIQRMKEARKQGDGASK